MLKRIAWAFGPLALVAVMGITSGGFPFNPLFGTAHVGATNPASRDTIAAENTTHLVQITELNTTADQPSLSFNAYGPNSGGLFSNDIHFNRYDGTFSAPTAILSGDFFGAIGGRAWDGSGSLSASAIGEQFLANENWSSTNHGAYFNFLITPSGGSVTRNNILQLSGTVAGGDFVDVLTNGSGDTSLGIVRFLDQVGTRYGYAGKATTGAISYESDAALQLVANNGVDRLIIDTSHNLTATGLTGTSPFARYADATANFTGNPGLEVSSIRVPKISYAGVTQTAATTCNITTVGQSNNVTSCTAAATGIPAVNFTTSYTTAPTCVATPQNVGTTATTVSFASTTVSAANMSNSQAGVAANISAFVICVGF
jgi:hypothetical protein